MSIYQSSNCRVQKMSSGGTHARVYAHRAAGSVISEILGKFQAGEGGGIFHAGAAVPARLTPSRLSSAAGGVEAPGSSRPASLHLRRRAQSRKLTGLHLHNKNASSSLGRKSNMPHRMRYLTSNHIQIKLYRKAKALGEHRPAPSS